MTEQPAFLRHERQSTAKNPRTSSPSKYPGTGNPAHVREQLIARFRRVRTVTERLLNPLAQEDFRHQSMLDVSPPYWNLGHTSWFFAQNVLRQFGRCPTESGNKTFRGLDYALNSYYESLGPRLPREDRGSVTSPSTDVVKAFRIAVDEAMLELLTSCSDQQLTQLAKIITIGCQHEQQHQELFLCEIQHIRWSAPQDLQRGYLDYQRTETTSSPGALRTVPFAASLTKLGHSDRNIVTDNSSKLEELSNSDNAFCWDNELPAHRVYVPDFEIGNRLITNAEWLEFIEDGGYQSPLLWLSNGWQTVQDQKWTAPLYWHRDGQDWRRFSLHGWHQLDPNMPVCHISFYEADAFARWYGEQHATWRGARLPREVEWEHAARDHGYDTKTANLLDDDLSNNAMDVTPACEQISDRRWLQQIAGTAWEWTSSHYEAFPGYRPYPGALTEYNGKFMDNQRVLRGGSFATPRTQARVSYRNFWTPTTRFQASSVRLLRDT